MKKQVKVGLILLTLVVLGVIGCPVAYFLTAYTKRTSHYISELTLDGQNIYFGAGHCLYCLDTQDQTLRELQCKKGSTFGQPAVDGERVYAQVGQFLVAVDLSTQEMVWRTDQSGEPGYEYGGSSRIHYPGSALLVEGIVITNLRQGLQFYDARSGDLLWHTEPNWMATHTYLLDDKMIWYIVHSIDERDYGSLKGLTIDTGTLEHTLDLRPTVRFDELLAINAQWIFAAMDRGKNRRHIFAINRQQLDQVHWFSDVYFQPGVSQPTIYNNLFIVRLNNSTVYALDVNTGQVVWSFTPGVNQATRGDVAQIVLFSVCERDDKFHDCQLYALDAATGSLIWKYYLNAEFHGLTEPVVSGMAVYVGNRDAIDILDLETGKLLQQIEVNSEYEFYISNSGLD